MEISVKLASEIDGNVREGISNIFAGGFYQWLKFFAKDTKQLAHAFEHAFILDHFYVAIIDGKIAGIAACTNGDTPSMKLCHKELRKHLGIIKGTIAGVVLKKEFENHAYPFQLEPNCGSIEFVATHENYRKQGVALSIITHICSVTPYDEYVLEVADTNIPAVQLYEKIGFKEFMRVALSARARKESGIDHFLYMKYKQ